MRRGKKLYWTKARCIRNASHYPNRGAWIKACKPAYTSAFLRGWLDECCAHMLRLRKKRKSWTKKACMSMALRFQSRNEWSKEEQSSYRYAAKRGWLSDCCRHMGPPLNARQWSKKDVLKEVRKFKSKKEWRKTSSASYSAAIGFGIGQNLFQKDKWFRRNYGSWSEEQLMEVARKFKTRTEWFSGSNSTYAAAKKKGCFERCCSHMPKVAKRR